MYIKLICIEILISFLVTKCQGLKSTFYLEKNRKGVFSVVRTIHDTFLMECSFACQRTKGCLKANFNPLERKCYLGSEDNINVADSEGWTLMNLRDKTFEMSSVKKTWMDAQTHCQSSGGSLALILAQWENMEALRKMILYTTLWVGMNSGAWIGARRKGQDWFWWSNGTSYTDKINGFYWALNEPNGQYETCIRYYNHRTWSGLLWDDYDCTITQHFLCQYSLKNV